MNETVALLCPPTRIQYEAGAGLTDVSVALAGTIGQTVVRGERTPLPQACSVESDPEMGRLRAEARQEAQAIMDAHVQMLCDGEYEKVPLEADAGGTARKLVAVGKVFGKDSPEYKQGWGALLRDCERRVGEAHRVNGWELFDQTVLELDIETGDFFCDGFSFSEMLRNGLTPATNPGCPEEPSRRINEFVEGQTDVVLVSKPTMQGRSTYTFSQCPQSLIDRYRRNPGNRVYSDYAPAVEKLMLRQKRFDPANNKIFMRQMAVPGLYINNEVINMALSEMGVIDGQRVLDRTEVHGTQAVVDDELIPDVVAMLRRLDEAASRYHGIPIYLGMPLQPGQKVDYEAVYIEAENRRQEQEDLTQRYALHLVTLEESGLDREIVKFEADEFIRTELLGTARHDPEKAAMMFDPLTAQGFREANDLEAQGRFMDAQNLRSIVEQSAPPAGGCGAGSCGLERLNVSEEAAAKDLLNTKPGEKTAKDTERPCPKCGEKEVVYSWTDTVRKKGCMNCKATEGVSPAGENENKKDAPLFVVTLRRPETGQVVTLKAGGK